MKKFIVIPTRLESTRLPEKVLLDLGGKTILQRVYDQCKKVPEVEVFIATDSIKIYENCRTYTKNVIMTSKNHESGTDRIIEAVRDFNNYYLVNVQGDEPFVNPELIQEIFKNLENSSAEAVTACERISSSEDLLNPNVVKVIMDCNKDAIYFSRSCIPYARNKVIKDENSFFKENKFYRHVGIYGYTHKFLNDFRTLKFRNIEELECLEQLRILENGRKIKVIETNQNTIGIDTLHDYEKALSLIKKLNNEYSL